MTTRQNTSEKSPIGWLLEEKNPSVHYFTLKDTQHRREDDPELQASKAVGKPSKWITLNALRVLKRLHKLDYEKLKEN